MKTREAYGAIAVEQWAQRRTRKDREHALAEHHVQVGMRAVIRDIQEYVVSNAWESYTGQVVNADEMRAYLYALLITAGGFEDGPTEGATPSQDDGDPRGEG